MSNTLSRIYVLSQFRDAVREVAPDFYRSLKHREEVLEAILAALETLEQKYDEEIEAEFSEEDMPKENAQQEDTGFTNKKGA